MTVLLIGPLYRASAYQHYLGRIAEAILAVLKFIRRCSACRTVFLISKDRDPGTPTPDLNRRIVR